MAMPSSPTLRIMASTVHTEGQGRVNPSVYLRPIAQPTSNNPATTRMSHAMGVLDGSWQRLDRGGIRLAREMAMPGHGGGECLQRGLRVFRITTQQSRIGFPGR